MATTLAMNAITVMLKGVFTNVLDVDSATAQLNESWTDTLANGTGSDQADILWWDTRPALAAGGNDDLDLNASLTGVFGGTVDFLHIKGIFIYNPATVAADTLTIGNGGANSLVNWIGGITETVTIGAGGVLLITDPKTGYACGAGASDILRVHNDSGANTIAFTIVVWGTST